MMSLFAKYHITSFGEQNSSVLVGSRESFGIILNMSVPGLALFHMRAWSTIVCRMRKKEYCFS